MTVRVDTTGTVTRLVLRGELDMLTAPEINAALDGIDGDLVFDLAGLTFIDSSGLALIVAQWRAARVRGHRLRIEGCAGRVLQTLRLAGVSDFLALAERPAV